MSPAEENAIRIRIAKLEQENAIMRKLSTRKGFYDAYFEKLKTAKTNTEAFNELNEEYHKLFGHYRYSDWNSFKVMTNYYNNKK
ncbi:hypothetical protein [Flavobacterium algicola]|uniref:hypothetical protein n=1 Tax=Flavobacterium algicola TaxID=556529 RepID=UPI001EFE9E6A|nr:hypothetical protein [Flavobacterium algicola]MCG9792497.1 hypothetical protein [Flavobacterium algicola]